MFNKIGSYSKMLVSLQNTAEVAPDQKSSRITLLFKRVMDNLFVYLFCCFGLTRKVDWAYEAGNEKGLEEAFDFSVFCKEIESQNLIKDELIKALTRSDIDQFLYPAQKQKGVKLNPTTILKAISEEKDEDLAAVSKQIVNSGILQIFPEESQVFISPEILSCELSDGQYTLHVQISEKESMQMFANVKIIGSLTLTISADPKSPDDISSIELTSIGQDSPRSTSVEM